MAYIYDDLRPDSTIEERYRVYDSAREKVIDRARDHASYTLPRLLEDGYGTQIPGLEDHDIVELFWHKPGQNATMLANKLTNAIFPANGAPFFEFEASRELRALYGAEQISDIEWEELDRLRVNFENDLHSDLQSSNFRSQLFMSILKVIVMPNDLMYMDDEVEFRSYRIDQFVIRRNIKGKIVEYITCDWVEADLLDEKLSSIPNKGSTNSYDRYEPLYTQIKWNNKKNVWEVKREFRETIYDRGEYKENESPYFCIQWNLSTGEDYGTSLTEQVFGLIRSGEATAKALVEGLMAGSQGYMGVSPTGVTDIESLVDRANWSWVSAREEDVFAIQPNTSSSVVTANEALRIMEEDLDEAFMTNASARLTGERVTAYQVDSLKSEQDEALGGMLTHMAQQVQRPVIQRLIAIRAKNKKIPEAFKKLLDEKAFTLKIKTGLDALGRQLDTLRLQAVGQTLGELAQIWPEMAEKLDGHNFAEDLIKNSGLDVERYAKPLERIRQERAEAQQAQVAAQAQEQAISSVGKIAEQQLGQ